MQVKYTKLQRILFEVMNQMISKCAKLQPKASETYENYLSVFQPVNFLINITVNIILSVGDLFAGNFVRQCLLEISLWRVSSGYAATKTLSGAICPFDSNSDN